MDNHNKFVVQVPREETANFMYFLKKFKKAKIKGMMFNLSVLPNTPVHDPDGVDSFGTAKASR